MPQNRSTVRRDTGAIHLRVDRLEQLFNQIDPFPFRERDLDADVEEFVVGWARELAASQPIWIIVEFGGDLAMNEAEAISAAFANFFTYRAEVLERDLRELFRIGRLSLAVGLAFLAVCIGLSQVLAGRLDGSVGRFIQESLIIAAWVANWRPIEIFLFDWWGIARTRNLYRRIAAARVEVRAEGSQHSPSGRF